MCWFSSTAAPVGTANSANGPVHRYTDYEINWNHEDANFRGTITMQVNGVWYSASFGTLLANTIYHLCGTYNGSSLVAFKDGQLITTNSTMSGDQVSEASTLHLCRHSIYASQYTNGTLYEARIYNRVLSNSEIADIYALKGQDTIYDGLHVKYLLSELAPGNVATGAGTIKNISNVSANGTPYSPTYTEALYIQEHRRAC
jgi:hypothetical protein